MDLLRLKKDFHKLIDDINNEQLLLEFYSLIRKRIASRDGKLWKSLTKEELEELNLAFEESENPGNLISQEDILRKYKKWL